jgi:creatinine amidohydrolase/Fe(II)-dependent formamide hydrolase-like protein
MQILCVLMTCLVVITTAIPAALGEVRIEHMTWVEVERALADRKTTIIIPTGGTEQNGPHIVLGKHNFIVAEAARQIAERAGDALVAPVIAYVPEGDIEAREGHMAYPGTISVPDRVFAGVLTSAAASFKAHGFKTIVFLGDSGGNQKVQEEVAAQLTDEWASWLGSGMKVFSASAYYNANGGRDWLMSQGETEQAIGRHAGIQDTSELMAVLPSGVDLNKANSQGGQGADGDATRASIGRGAQLLEMKIQAAVKQIIAERE